MVYKKECIFCKQEIVMTERLGKWYPSDLDGGIHYCPKKQKQEPKTPELNLKNLLEAQLFLVGIEARVKKLESIVLDPRIGARK